MRFLTFFLGLLALLAAAPVFAQNTAWVQIEAQPDLRTATDRARAYAAVFPQVQGYKLKTGWYGIAIGPLSSDEAAAELGALTAQSRIPADSYITDGANFRGQFWPPAAQTTEVAPLMDVPSLAAPAETAPAETAPDAAAQTAPSAEPMEPEETIREARAAESTLSATERQDLQKAMQWFGFYPGRIDGSFGSGTRNAMADWQIAQGIDPTGVLTTSQRTALMEAYIGEESAFGFETVTEAESGIEIILPMAMVSFDRYTPPFVRYAAKGGSGLTAMLISEPGTKASLAGLYDVLSSLEIMPAAGARSLEDTSFTIHGRNDTIESVTYVTIVGGNVKGYLLSWNLGLSDKMGRILPMVQASFRSTGDKALDPGLVPLDEAVRRGLLSGLETKKPALSRSGFFIDAKGSVLTSSAAVAQCGRITLEHGVPARVSFEDKVNGIAVLTPDAPLAPLVIAGFATTAPRKGAEIAVSGYSYEGRLPASVLTRGTLEDLKGLNGEPGLSRLALHSLAGDAGGPVLDASGAVVGMLLAADPAAARQLPPGVAFAATSAALAQLLTNPQGPALTLNAALPGARATPDALNAAARGMTVLVSCWK
ncbi:MAG: serine protease [Cypionkella sp.]